MGINIVKINKIVIVFFLLLVFSVSFAQAQPPVTDPSKGESPIPNTQVPPAELYQLLKDKNSTGKKTGDDVNGKLKERIDKKEVGSELEPFVNLSIKEIIEQEIKINEEERDKLNVDLKPVTALSVKEMIKEQIKLDKEKRRNRELDIQTEIQPKHKQSRDDGR